MTTPSDPLADPLALSAVQELRGAVVAGRPCRGADLGGGLFFLALVTKLQDWVFTDLPEDLGFHSEPAWWPFSRWCWLGLLVGLTMRYLPGEGGTHRPTVSRRAEALRPHRAARDRAGRLATLSLGVVLGPEAPLIALGAGLGALAVRLVKRDAPARAQSSSPPRAVSPPSARCSARP